MRVHPDMTIETLIEDFSKAFPGLRIELYSKAHGEGENSAQSTEIDHSKTLKEINSDIKATELTLDPQMTVGDFESKFKDNYNLNIQVFRRSNKLWLQTSATDNWTLEVQNRKGLHSVQD